MKEICKKEYFERNYFNFGLKMILKARNFASLLALNFINWSSVYHQKEYSKKNKSPLVKGYRLKN